LGTVVGADAAQGAKIIRQQTEAMTRIIRQLVDFARAGKPHRRAFDVYEVLAGAVAMLQPLANKKQVELSFVPGGPTDVDADAGLLQQVITNLVVNAIDASTAGGRVVLAAERLDREAPPDVTTSNRAWIALSVTDDGAGIDAEILEHIFEPFFTTKDVGEGTGLGLAVAWGIVREHGGWISAGNRSPRGATFTVYLPARPPLTWAEDGTLRLASDTTGTRKNTAIRS
jgi:signal transduction histidine kinase